MLNGFTGKFLYLQILLLLPILPNSVTCKIHGIHYRQIPLLANSTPFTAKINYLQIQRPLAEMLHRTADVASRRRLRSAATSTLVLPLTRRSTLGDRAFPVAASRAWNSLPAFVRDIQSLPAFRQKLKLTLFSDSFAS